MTSHTTSIFLLYPYFPHVSSDRKTVDCFWMRKPILLWPRWGYKPVIPDYHHLHKCIHSTWHIHYRRMNFIAVQWKVHPMFCLVHLHIFYNALDDLGWFVSHHISGGNLLIDVLRRKNEMIETHDSRKKRLYFCRFVDPDDDEFSVLQADQDVTLSRYHRNAVNRNLQWQSGTNLKASTSRWKKSNNLEQHAKIQPLQRGH